jgi:hypothetical protein
MFPGERIVKSPSTLTITWTSPDLDKEQWEFFHHPAKQEFYRNHGLTWERLTESAEAGQLIPYPRGGELEGVPVGLSHHSYDDYCHYLARARRGYRLNYNRLEADLQRNGSLTLPAATVLRGTGEALLFSGYRRLCLAWNYGMVPHVWMVPLGLDDPFLQTP